MTEDKKAKRLARLAKLLASAADTSEGGEAAAMAALDFATKAAAELGMTLEEAQEASAKANNKADWITTGPMTSGLSAWRGTFREFCATDMFLSKSISRFCGVKVRIASDALGNPAVQYFGDEASVGLAVWIRKTINHAMNEAWKSARYALPDEARVELQNNDAQKAMANKRFLQLQDDFNKGMSDRLRERMLWLHKRANPPVDTPTGRTEVAVIKQDLLDRAAKEADFRDAQYAATTRARDSDVHAMGGMAGNSVDLGRGIGGGVKALPKM